MIVHKEKRNGLKETYFFKYIALNGIITSIAAMPERTEGPRNFRSNVV